MRHPVYNNDGSVKRHGCADALAFSERHFALVAKFRSCRLTKARAHLNLSMETQLHHPFMRSPAGGDHDSRLSIHSLNITPSPSLVGSSISGAPITTGRDSVARSPQEAS